MVEGRFRKWFTHCTTTVWRKALRRYTDRFFSRNEVSRTFLKVMVHWSCPIHNNHTTKKHKTLAQKLPFCLPWVHSFWPRLGPSRGTFNVRPSTKSIPHWKYGKSCAMFRYSPANIIFRAGRTTHRKSVTMRSLLRSSTSGIVQYVILSFRISPACTCTARKNETKKYDNKKGWVGEGTKIRRHLNSITSDQFLKLSCTRTLVH